MKIFFDGLRKNKKEHEFGGRFINIGLINVAVAAARVVERPPRCGNKGRKKRRCKQNACENHHLRQF